METEIKVLDIDIDEVRNKVKELGCPMVKKENQENYLYKLPKSLQAQDKIGFVRIRKTHSLIDGKDKIILCTKILISQNETRTAEEEEIEVLDFEGCRRLVSSLDLEFIKRFDKYRESYILDDVLIEIDILDKNEFPDPYIELEGNSKDEIYAVLDKLSLPRQKATSLRLDEIKALRNISK